MRIYTKTGDQGETGLFGGKRVRKDSPRIHAVGSVDELNALVGACRTFKVLPRVDEMLHSVQRHLYTVGADLGTPADGKSKVPRITKDDAALLEQWIDELSEFLKPLEHFILPGGCSAAARLHVACSVCRRAERAAVTLADTEKIGDPVLQYLNRLSDLLFVMARYVNNDAGVEEEKI